MVITILEAKVEPQLRDLLRKIYTALTREAPSEIKASYLTQDQNDRDVWRIITVWESMDALDAMRKSGETPVGVVIFNKVNASPVLSVHSVEVAAAAS